MNKQAIAYIRISDKDQSNFSLQGQEKYIRDYCIEKDITLLETFIDDGRSAKNFDRPDWQNLENFIKQHHRKVDQLVVVKYDRFTRDTARGLLKIETLEKKYQIIIASVFEQMYIDYDSPFFFKQRADILVNAEFELLVIRDRTRFGMVEALNSGRYVSKAPIGYLNSRDDNNKPQLLIDDRRAHVIEKIFEQYAAGHPFNVIAAEARRNGINLTGKSAIPRILTNPVYAGMLNVPAYRKQPAKIVNAKHEAIISKDLWHTVQNKLNAKNTPRQQPNEEVPLRAQVMHTCGKLLTAGKSKGKNKYYWHYKCNYCPHTNFSADAPNGMHAKFTEVLKNLSLTDHQVEYLLTSAEREMKEQSADRKVKAVRAEKDWRDAVSKLESLEEKFISNEVNPETYRKWYSRYHSEADALKQQLDHLRGDNNLQWNKYRAGLKKLTDVSWVFNCAPLGDKHEFIRLVFNCSLSYDGVSYRTPYIIDFFRHNALKLKEKGLLILESSNQNLLKNSRSAPEGSSIEHLPRFLELISRIKTA